MKKRRLKEGTNKCEADTTEIHKQTKKRESCVFDLSKPIRQTKRRRRAMRERRGMQLLFHGLGKKRAEIEVNKRSKGEDVRKDTL